jgi:hypothetical protein
MARSCVVLCLAVGAWAFVPTVTRPEKLTRPLAQVKSGQDVSSRSKTARGPVESPLPPKKAIDEVTDEEEEAVRIRSAEASAAAPAAEAPIFETKGKWRVLSAFFCSIRVFRSGSRRARFVGRRSGSRPRPP